MTYRSRSAARAAHKKSIRDAAVQAEVDRKVRSIPPRVEVKLEPIPVMGGKGYGPASAFECGATIERRMEYDRKGDCVYVHRLNEPPSQRSVIVAIQPSPRMAYRRGHESFLNAAYHMQSQAEFHVERWRWNVTDDDTSNVVEWFTWVPKSDRRAYPAVRQAKAYIDRAARFMDMDIRPPDVPIDETTAGTWYTWASRASSALRETRECLEIVSAAAHEWLCEPDEEKL